jgi:RsiW-degrading membrane proteinase PrsW (M82 family)
MKLTIRIVFALTCLYALYAAVHGFYEGLKTFQHAKEIGLEEFFSDPASIHGTYLLVFASLCDTLWIMALTALCVAAEYLFVRKSS